MPYHLATPVYVPAGPHHREVRGVLLAGVVGLEPTTSWLTATRSYFLPSELRSRGLPRFVRLSKSCCVVARALSRYELCAVASSGVPSYAIAFLAADSHSRERPGVSGADGRT